MVEFPSVRIHFPIQIRMHWCSVMIVWSYCAIVISFHHTLDPVGAIATVLTCKTFYVQLYWSGIGVYQVMMETSYSYILASTCTRTRYR